MVTDARSHHALHRYAVFTAAATFLLLIAGSLVTSTDSGLAVPDWPLSYGTWWPPMVGGILFEHGHRMIAGVVGLLMLGLAAWLWRAEPRAWVRRLAYAAAAAVVAQALLGGLTVLLLLPAFVSIAHACLAQVVFGLVVSVALVTAPRWDAQAAGGTSRALRGMSLALVGAVFVQVALGAIIRHTGVGVWPHLMVAVVVVGVAHALAARARRALPEAHPARPRAARLLWLVTLQLVAGLVVWRHRGWLAARTLHVATGALVFAQAAALAWALARQTRGSRSRQRPDAERDVDTASDILVTPGIL